MCDNQALPNEDGVPFARIEFGTDESGTPRQFFSGATGDDGPEALKAALMAAGPGSLATTIAFVSVSLPAARLSALFVCLRAAGAGEFVHQGAGYLNTTSLTTIAVEDAFVPSAGSAVSPGIRVFLVILLLTISGLFTVLSLGMLTFDVTELEMYIRDGTASEQRLAAKLRPFRERGDWLLCTILACKVPADAIATVLLVHLVGSVGGTAVAIAGITIVGSWIPHAFLGRSSMLICGAMRWVVGFFMLASGPVSYPLGRALYMARGVPVGYAPHRARHQEVAKIREDERTSEQKQIVQGSLTFSEKTVECVMTKIKNVCTLPLDTTLDFKTMLQIVESGYSRIPVTIGQGEPGAALANPSLKPTAPLTSLCWWPHWRSPGRAGEDVKIVGIFLTKQVGAVGHRKAGSSAGGAPPLVGSRALLTATAAGVASLPAKQMAFINPQENFPLASLVKFYNNEVLEVHHATRLIDMLDLFKVQRTHIAMVQKVTQDLDERGEGGQDGEVAKLVGIITFEVAAALCRTVHRAARVSSIAHSHRCWDNVAACRTSSKRF